MDLHSICRKIALKTLNVPGMRLMCMADSLGEGITKGDVIEVKENHGPDDKWLRFKNVVGGFSPLLFRKYNEH